MEFKYEKFTTLLLDLNSSTLARTVKWMRKHMQHYKALVKTWSENILLSSFDDKRTYFNLITEFLMTTTVIIEEIKEECSIAIANVLQRLVNLTCSDFNMKIMMSVYIEHWMDFDIFDSDQLLKFTNILTKPRTKKVIKKKIEIKQKIKKRRPLLKKTLKKNFRLQKVTDPSKLQNHKLDCRWRGG